MIWTTILNTILFFCFNIAALSAQVETDAFVLRLKPDSSPLEISAPRAAVLAADNRFFLFERRANEVQPIASITKLMTALVFLENNPGWEEVYKITADDKIDGGRLNLFLGDRVRLRDLFYTSLVASDNGATMALVHASGLSEEEFVKKMNFLAHHLGLEHTSFKDPIGLSADNVSTAREVALLAQAAFKQAEIREATTKSEYHFTTLDGRDKDIESTDYLLFDPAPGAFEVLGGKTGYTDKAGYCFVGRLRNENGRELISVVLNSTGKNERFVESKQLANWVLNSYNWNKENFK